MYIASPTREIYVVLEKGKRKRGKNSTKRNLPEEAHRRHFRHHARKPFDRNITQKMTKGNVYKNRAVVYIEKKGPRVESDTTSLQ